MTEQEQKPVETLASLIDKGATARDPEKEFEKIINDWLKEKR